MGLKYTLPVEQFIKIYDAAIELFSANTTVMQFGCDDELTTPYVKEYWKYGEWSAAQTTAGVTLSLKRSIAIPDATVTSAQSCGIYKDNLLTYMTSLKALVKGVNTVGMTVTMDATVNTSLAATVAGAGTLTECAVAGKTAKTNVIAATAHGLADADSVYFYQKSGGGMPGLDGGGSLVERKEYFVKKIDADKFKIEAVKASGTYLEFNTDTTFNFTKEDKATATIACNSHGMSVDDKVWLVDAGNGMPYWLGGGQADTRLEYYVKAKNANDFTLAKTKGGTAEKFASDTAFKIVKAQNTVAVSTTAGSLAATFYADEIV